jgi:hypothetical protein
LLRSVTKSKRFFNMKRVKWMRNRRSNTLNMMSLGGFKILNRKIKRKKAWLKLCPSTYPRSLNLKLLS